MLDTIPAILMVLLPSAVLGKSITNKKDTFQEIRLAFDSAILSPFTAACLVNRCYKTIYNDAEAPAPSWNRSVGAVMVLAPVSPRWASHHFPSFPTLLPIWGFLRVVSLTQRRPSEAPRRPKNTTSRLCGLPGPWKAPNWEDHFRGPFFKRLKNHVGERSGS